MGRHGPILLSAILETADHKELVQLVRRSIECCRDHGGDSDNAWIDSTYGFIPQKSRRDQWYSKYDAAQDRGDKTTFEKDTPNEPPFAWVLYWLGKASNLFGGCVPQTFRRWGYIMWDAKRLETPGIMLFMEMSGRWMGKMDPREDLRERGFSHLGARW